MVNLSDFAEALSREYKKEFPDYSASQIAELSRITVIEYIKLMGINA